MPVCLVLSDDLLDASRIAGHGRAAGLDVLQCRDPNALVASLGKGPVLALLDLHNPGLDIAEVVAALRAGGVKRVIGYGSHVDAARLKAARAAGCDEALPRSAFFEGLEAKMEAWVPRPDK
jgi:CheY-like chemotaxis protein